MGMRRLGPQVAAVALTVLVCFLGTHSTPTADAQTVPAKPNFVFILADDMREDDLGYMPKTRSLLGGKGTRFDKAYVSLPVCCPARSTVMRGQYAHNTGSGSTRSGRDTRPTATSKTTWQRASMRPATGPGSSAST
jgi:hypothetical protein